MPKFATRPITETDRDGFLTSLDQVVSSLTPGIPVMLHTYRVNDMISRSDSRKIFFSDGTFDRTRGIFGMQQGKRNYAVVEVGEDGTVYRVVGGSSPYDSVQVNTPNFWMSHDFNEGTFSPSGGSTITSFHETGTPEIAIGQEVIDRFPEAVHALRFGSDALYFELPSTYAMPGYLITNIGDSRDVAEERMSAMSKIARVHASMALLSGASAEGIEPVNWLSATQVGHFRDGVKRFRERGFPVAAEDYLLREPHYPQRNIAIVKPQGILYGSTFILPYRDELGPVVEAAFSPERVKKMYPR